MFCFSELSFSDIALALEKAIKKPPVIWLSGQSCGGCTFSFFNSTNPSISEIILDLLSIRFLSQLTSDAGEDAFKIFTQTREKVKEKYYLLIDGSIPLNGKYCSFGELNGREIFLIDLVKEVAREAKAILAVGTCASYGGIPKSGPTRAEGVQEILDKKVINIPGCPPHPDWIVGTLVNLFLVGSVELDFYQRPKLFYSSLVHQSCPRRSLFEEGKFLTDWNNSRQKDWCLLLKGCKGIATSSDCPARGWNDNLNWCIKANAPCAGCTEPRFYKDFSPLYEEISGIPIPFFKRIGVSTDSIGEVVAGAGGVGLGIHFIRRVLKKRLKNKGKR